MLPDDTNQFVAIGLGELLWDLFPTGKKLGGAPANFAYHLNALGIESYPISSIGDDQLGTEILTAINSKSLSKKYLQINSNYPTGIVKIELNDSGIPNYNIIENVAWDYIKMSDDLVEIAKLCNVVCFGSLAQRSDVTKDTMNEFINYTSQNCIRLFDINLRQNYYTNQIIESSLQRSKVFKLNDDELHIVSSIFGFSGTQESIVLQLMKNYCLEVLALTRGNEGSVLYFHDDTSEIKPKQMNIADTVGAGDAFTAGMAFGLLNQLNIERTHIIANNLASFVCSKRGATPTIDSEDLKKILNI
jgi:fructokinase